MSQILNIFKKDTRQLWLEIVISVVLTFAFVCIYPNEWKVFHDQSKRNLMADFIGILVLLMVASWWLLIARVIQAESLVGDRQFWITRPYGWKKLLAAKLLFGATWIGLPYFLAQMYLLVEAGFNPLAYVPGLLYTLMMVVLAFLLPVFCCACITSTFARFTLTVIGGLIVIWGYLFLAFSRGNAATIPYSNAFLFPLLFAGCVAAITLQYATRRVWVTRGLLLALPILLAISVWAYGRPSLVDKSHPWPSAGSAAPVSIALARSTTGPMMSPTAEDPVQTRSWDGKDYMSLPLRFTGVAAGYAVFTEDLKITLTAADGREWTSPWQATMDRILPGTHQPRIELIIPPDVYDRFKAGPVTLRVSFAVSRYQADAVTKTAFPAGDAAMAGIGFCTSSFRGITSFQCRSAIDQPRLTLLEATWWNGPCSDGLPRAAAIADGYSWLEPQAMNLSIVSVRTPFLWFRNGVSGEDTPGRGWQICPGTPLTLTQYHLVDRTREELTLPNFVLPVRVRATD